MNNLLAFTREKPGMTPQDTVVALTTLSFDIAVFELWLPLTVGARILLAGRDAGADGQALMDLVERERATVLQATPATWRLLLGAGWEPKRTVKLISTGEAMPRDLGTELVAKSPDVWDMYGPTETTVWSTWWKRTEPGGDRAHRQAPGEHPGPRPGPAHAAGAGRSRGRALDRRRPAWRSATCTGPS